MNQPVQSVIRSSASLLRLADGDLAAVLQKYPQWNPVELLADAGGLSGLEAGYPLSAPEIVRRLTARWGAGAVRRLRAADQRILQAVRSAAEVHETLDRMAFERSARAADVAATILRRAAGSYRLSYAEVLTVLGLGDQDQPAGRPDDLEPAPSSLAVLGEMLWSTAYTDPAALVATITGEAMQAQEIADDFVEQGRQKTGVVVAHHDTDDVDYRAGAVLAPTAGCENEDRAIAQARLTGVATAVLQTWDHPPTFHTYALEPGLTWPDALAVNGPPRMDLTTAGADAAVVALTTAEGHVLRSTGGRYFASLAIPRDFRWSANEYRDAEPAPYLAADLELADLQSQGDDAATGDVYRANLPLEALFYQTVLDYTLAALAQSERKLITLRRRYHPIDSPLPLPEPGAALQTQTAALRPLVHAAALLAWVMGDREPSEAESRSTVRLTSQIGAIAAAEPLAALFIEVDRDTDEAPELDEFTDRLAGEAAGGATAKAIAAIDLRLDNIVKLRAHLHAAHPVAARRLQAVHPDALQAFTLEQLDVINAGVYAGDLRDLAADAGLELVNILLMTIGTLAPPAALPAAGLSAAIGVVRNFTEFRDAELLTAMANLDVPDGFQLAGPAEAQAARRAAWVGLGLCLVDFLFLGADVGRHLRRAGTGLDAASPLATALGASAGPFRLARPRVATMAALPGGGLAAKELRGLEAAAELANHRRLSSAAFKELAAELRLPQRRLRNLLIAALDETSRLTVMEVLRKAARGVLGGGKAKAVKAAAVLKAAENLAVKPGRRVKELLIVGSGEAELGWGLEQLRAGRRATVVAPARNAGVGAFEAGNGRFVQGAIADLPVGYRCSVAREELASASALTDVEAFLSERGNRLELGGQWVVVTESREAAGRLAGAAPRDGLRIWTTEYQTIRNGKAITRYAVVMAKPRPTTMIALSGLGRPAKLTDARIGRYLTVLQNPANANRLRRKLGDVWHQGMVEAGQVATGRLANLTGNIGEILSDGYKAEVLAARVAEAETAGAVLQREVRRIDGVTKQSKEFTDDLITVEREGNLYVTDVFEVKAGPRGGQEGRTQLFGWVENELEEGDRIVAGGRTWLYKPGSTEKGQIISLARARRHLVTAQGAENVGRRTADQIAASVVTAPLEPTAADIEYLARRIIEGLPPAP
ncbi:hypothetical protein [Actinoplanes sp. NPDC026623]|uniref:hypothetical protein n=1 Tax=Actinoplanes sp. NPDC026623 TaxID=3155610 RepID=UPI0033CBBC35